MVKKIKAQGNLPIDANAKVVTGLADNSNKEMNKRAYLGGSVGSMPGGNDIGRVPLMYIDPMLDPILMMFPKENVKELNRRLRHYYTFHPLVHSVIDLHASYALSDFELRCDDKVVERYYNDVKERIDLLTMMINLNRDFWLLGNSYMYGDWDKDNGEWTGFNQFPAENIEIHRAYVGGTPVYFLKADEEIKRVMQSSKAADSAVAETIPNEFKQSILRGVPYQLANERLIHFANRPAQYTLLGESLVKSCLKDLMYEDKLRLLQFTYADRATFPIKHWKVGSESNRWIPGKKHMDEVKNLILQGVNDPDYQLITHPFVNLDIKDQHGMWADIKSEFDFVQKRLMVGLFCSEAMIGGEASPYAKDMLNMKVVMHRYMLNRNLEERLIREKVFLPIAMTHGLIKRTQAELNHRLRLSSSSNNYILPKFFYRERVNLLSSQSEQDLILRLRERKEIPFEIIADMFGWDMDQLKTKFQAESCTEFDPIYKASRDDLPKKKGTRDAILNGKFKKNDYASLDKVPEDANGALGAELGGGDGRPPLPSGDLKKPDTAIRPNGPGETSPRAKQQDKGELPEPSVPSELTDLLS